VRVAASALALLIALGAIFASRSASAGVPGAAEDMRSLLRLRQGLDDVLAWSASAGSVFADGAPGSVPPREERQAAWSAWSRFLDYQIALEALARRHESWWRRHGDARGTSFAIARAANLARYRAALQFIDQAERGAAAPALLDDAVPELGLPAGTYSSLKSDVLNVAEGAQWLAWSAAAPIVRCRSCGDLADAVEADMRAIGELAKGRGEALTLRNATDTVGSLGRDAWFPVQARAAEWMGDTKVRRRGVSLVSREQAREAAGRMEPGDILLTRREWYVSNVGLPGWWSHAALYVGTPEERRAWASDQGVKAWVRSEGRQDGDFEALLAERVPAARRASVAADDEGPRRVLEAVSEGVSFNPIEHAADCDSLAVLRPRVTRAGRAAALLRAFEYAGRPYDYDFDFRTDSALVCTELVCKAYEARGEGRLIFPIATVMGRPVLPANDIARAFDETFGTEAQQVDLVAFLDGTERGGMAREASVDEFRRSWKRPKWHVVSQALKER
jgi:hypothetical protein